MTNLHTLDVATPSTRGNSFITDIAVTFLLDGDPWLPTAAWVRLLVALDLPASTARTSLHRMDKGNYLDRITRNGSPGYAMSRRWREFVHAAQLNLQGVDVEDQTRWVLVIFSIPETHRDLRHLLRTQLERAGLAPLGNGSWIGPEVIAPGLRQLLQESALNDYLHVFLADHEGSGEDLARECWDLESAQRDLVAFEHAARAAADGTMTPEQSFVSVVSTHNTWRRLQPRIPALPSRMFPNGDGSRHGAEAALRHLLDTHLPAAREWVGSLRPENVRHSG